MKMKTLICIYRLLVYLLCMDRRIMNSGAKEMYALAQKLRELTLDALLFETILDGTVLPDINEAGDLLISVTKPENYAE
jgi:hypothetical protein